VFSVPYIFLIAVLTSVAVGWYFARAVSGRRLLATGGNPLAARLSGISNDGSIFRAHLISGMLIGVAAMVTIASAPGINRSIGGDWLLPSFAAPIIGGVLLTGGGVAVFGTVMAAAVLRLIDVARAQFSLDPSWLNFVIGAVVLSTVALSEWRKRRETRRLMVAAVHT
jgi:ribose transport system permease protein